MFNFDLIYCRSRFRSEAPLTKPQNFQGLLYSKLTRSQAEGSSGELIENPVSVMACQVVMLERLMVKFLTELYSSSELD